MLEEENGKQPVLMSDLMYTYFSQKVRITAVECCLFSSYEEWITTYGKILPIHLDDLVEAARALIENFSDS